MEQHPVTGRAEILVVASCEGNAWATGSCATLITVVSTVERVPQNTHMRTFQCRSKYLIFTKNLKKTTCSLSSCMMAFCKYRTPPWINLVLRLLVPQEKSSLSTKAVERPVKTTILCFLPFLFFQKLCRPKLGA